MPELPIILSFVLAVILIPVFLIFAVVRMLIKRRDSQMLSRDEQSQLRQLWDSLQKMEDRIANLETILMHGGRPGVSQKEEVR
jgi:phage shock protein B